MQQEIFFQQITTFASQFFLNFIGKIPALVIALVVLWIGLKVIKHLKAFIHRQLMQYQMDPSIRPIIAKLTTGSLKIILFLTCAGIAGVQTTSFITALGAAGVTVGLALQGSLSNIAGSFLILFFRPFKVGDYIKAQGNEGSVMEISFFTTKLRTFDFQIIYLPNGALANGPIINLTEESVRRVDIKATIAYENSIELAKQVLLKLALSYAGRSANMEPKVLLTNYGDSAIELTLQLWCPSENYHDAYQFIFAQIKDAFDKENLYIPYPQQVVHHPTQKTSF
jgi:small conductance mechanosensitive channel